MKQTRRKLTNSLRNRALEIIAAHPNGCTEAMLAADNIPADVLIELVTSGLVLARVQSVSPLVTSGLVLARVQSVFDEHGFLEVTTLWISEAGEAAWMLAHARNS